MKTNLFGTGRIQIEPNQYTNASSLWRQVLATFASCCVNMNAGLTYGITAVLLPELRKDEEFNYDGSQDSWIASVPSLAMVFGSLFIGTLVDRYGRKPGFIIVCIPYIIGWLCIAVAKTTTLIIIGRLITGLSAGAQRPVTLVYVGEITDPKYRTISLFLSGFMIQVGVLVSHLLGSFLSWRVSILTCLGIAVISPITFLFLKESPLWLISNERTVEGVDAFRWFRGTGEAAETELKSVLDRQSDNEKINVKSFINIICNRSFITPFSVVILIMMNIQFSGVNVINFYAKDIFDRTFVGRVDSFVMMITADCVRGSVAVIACLLTKIIQRKTAYLISSFGLAAFLYMLVVYLILNPSSFVWIPVTCLILNIGLSGSLVTIGWTFVPEVMPNKIRGLGSGLASSIAYILLFTAVKVSPDIMNKFGESAMYASFATSSVICGLLLSYLLPNTSGKTLQSIEDTYYTSKGKITEQTAL